MNAVQKQTLTGCQPGCLIERPEHDGVGFSCQRGLCLRALECFEDEVVARIRSAAGGLGVSCLM